MRSCSIGGARGAVGEGELAAEGREFVDDAKAVRAARRAKDGKGWRLVEDRSEERRLVVKEAGMIGRLGAWSALG